MPSKHKDPRLHIQWVESIPLIMNLKATTPLKSHCKYQWTVQIVWPDNYIGHHTWSTSALITARSKDKQATHKDPHSTNKGPPQHKDDNWKNRWFKFLLLLQNIKEMFGFFFPLWNSVLSNKGQHYCCQPCCCCWWFLMLLGPRPGPEDPYGPACG